MAMGLLPSMCRVMIVLAAVVSADHALDRHAADQRPPPRPLVVRVDDEIAAEDCAHFHSRLENLLTATSEQLYETTRRRQQWGRVRVLAPANWQHCLRGVDVVDQWPNRLHDIDLLVGRTHPLLEDLPWARQFGPCGVQGSDLYLSHRFVQSTSTENLVRHGRQLLREWIKYRYGVFDEVGYRSDDQYPLTYNEANQQHPNDCSTFHNSSEIVYEVDSRSNATVAVNVTTSRRGTSILASLDAYDFCDVATHNRALPTKQNILCEERSVWEVMRQHPDFRPEWTNPRSRRSAADPWKNSTSETDQSEGEQTTETPPAATSDAAGVSTTESDDSATTEAPPAPFQAPKFEYVFPSRSRYVLVLDRSHLMARKNRWTLLRRALYRWIHSIPNDTQLAVVVGGAEPAQVLPWTRVTADNRDGLVGRIPRRPLATPQPFCPHCALQLAAQLVKDREEATCCGGHVILVTGAAGQETEHLDALRRTLDASGALLHVVAFPSQMAFQSFGQLTAPGGAFLAVPEATEAGTVTQWRLTSALLQVLRHDGRPDAPNQIYKEYLMPRDGLSVLGSFTLDAPLGTNVWIVAHCVDEADLDTVEVISPTGRIFDLPQVSDGMLHIRIAETREFGDWSYRLRFSHPTRDHLAAAVEVTAQPTPPAIKQGQQQQQEPISVRTWNNVGHQLINASQSAIILYAQVLQAQTPIINAKVTALIYRPKRMTAPPAEPIGNATADVDTDAATTPAADDEPLEIQLHDRGTGDPDITRSDGIYSAYFTGANDVPGHYSVVIRVSDNGRRASIPLRSYGEITSCCGSFVPYGDSMPCQPFSRIVNGPSFTTTDGPSAGDDVYPPGRISDLRVERVLNGSGEAELVWTAPGGDFDSGSAAFYEIRCYTDRSTLNDPASAILVHASLTPVPGTAGAWQRSTVAVPWPNQLFYYAVVAVDASGNRGRVSNIVPVFIDEPPPPPTTLPPPSTRDDSEDAAANGTLSGAVWRNPSSASSVLTETQLYAIAGGVAGFVLLLIVLSVAAFASRRKSAQPDGVKGGAPATVSAAKIQVEPLKTGPGAATDLNDTIKDSSFCSSAPSGGVNESRDRPVYKIYVNNAYIQEEDGELKIVTPDGRIIQRGSPWFSTLPRGRSLNNLEGASINDLSNMHWSLPRSKTSPHRHKVLTNGSIMQTGGGSQGLLGGVVGACGNGSGSSAAVGSSGPGSSGATGGTDGTSISSKPSVSSDDTGIEVNDHHGVLEADSRDDSADSEQVPSNGLTPMLLPPPGFGTLQPPYQYQNGYVPMYGGYSSALVPALPPSPPGSQDARVVRIPSIPNQFDHHHLIETESPQSWMTEFNDPSYSQPSNRRPLVGHLRGFSSGSFRESNLSSDDSQPVAPSTPTSLSGPKKKRHISFV